MHFMFLLMITIQILISISKFFGILYFDVLNKLKKKRLWEYDYVS